MAPSREVGAEFREEWAVYVLAEEHPLFSPVSVDRERARCVPRRVEAYDSRSVAEAQCLLSTLESYVDGQRSQVQTVPGSARSYGVAILNGAGVKDVHDDPDPEPFLEVGGAAHVVDVTVGENECGEARRIEAEKLYVPHDLGRISARAAIHEEKLPRVHEIDRTIPLVSQIGASHKIDAISHSFRGGEAEHTRSYHVTLTFRQ